MYIIKRKFTSSGVSSDRDIGHCREVRGSNPSQDNCSLYPCVHSALNEYLGLSRPDGSKCGEESNGKLPQNAVYQEQSGSLMLGLSVELSFNRNTTSTIGLLDTRQLSI
ncbi:hypothetical protein PoB_004686000 [Plakobranchus ocellatus]|uniref:Uncharacterized protein n=1 Tax=Plakobranchus ocellatus TaxID=259542 RepID=A0AAV4BMT8_9GAST|nr:hypothetical protein PoB_004686000 [Plakobranchus ocellatus]